MACLSAIGAQKFQRQIALCPRSSSCSLTHVEIIRSFSAVPSRAASGLSIMIRVSLIGAVVGQKNAGTALTATLAALRSQRSSCVVWITATQRGLFLL